MEYKCNKCKDTFCLTQQDRWSVYCFHCGKGILQFLRFEHNEVTENELKNLRKIR